MAKNNKFSKSFNSIERALNQNKRILSRKMSLSAPNLDNLVLNNNNKNNLFLYEIDLENKEESSLIKLKTFKSSSFHLDNLNNQIDEETNNVTIISLSRNIQKIKSLNKSDRNLSLGRAKINIKKSGTCSMEDKAIRKTIVPIVLFYLYWLPYTFAQIGKLLSDSYYFELANVLSLSIGFCHSSLNPIIYCCTNVEIRKAMRLKLKKIFLFNPTFVYLIDKYF